MRASSSLVLALTLLAGCTVGDSPKGGSAGPDASTSSKDAPVASGPNVAAAVDRATVSTELGKAETVTVNLTATGGFAGDVTLTPSISGTGGEITVSPAATVTLTANGTGSSAFTVTIPSDALNTSLSPTLTIAVSSSLGNQTLTSAFTIANVFTIDHQAGQGSDPSKHFQVAGNAIMIRRGTEIHVTNHDTVTHITHGGGIIPHEGGGGGLPGGTYVVDTEASAVGSTGTIGCHDHPGGGNGQPSTYIKVTLD